jgi:hypothetical protein
LLVRDAAVAEAVAGLSVVCFRSVLRWPGMVLSRRFGGMMLLMSGHCFVMRARPPVTKRLTTERGEHSHGREGAQ